MRNSIRHPLVTLGAILAIGFSEANANDKSSFFGIKNNMADAEIVQTLHYYLSPPAM